jgi:hypothetical protein
LSSFRAFAGSPAASKCGSQSRLGVQKRTKSSEAKIIVSRVVSMKTPHWRFTDDYNAKLAPFVFVEFVVFFAIPSAAINLS